MNTNIKVSDLNSVDVLMFTAEGGKERFFGDTEFYSEKETQEVVRLPDGFKSASQRRRQEVSWFTGRTRTVLTAGFSKKPQQCIPSRRRGVL